jgi:hypothetical protein
MSNVIFPGPPPETPNNQGKSKHGMFPEDFEAGEVCGWCLQDAKRLHMAYRDVVFEAHEVDILAFPKGKNMDIIFLDQKPEEEYDWREEVKKIIRWNNLRKWFAEGV